MITNKGNIEILSRERFLKDEISSVLVRYFDQADERPADILHLQDEAITQVMDLIDHSFNTSHHSVKISDEPTITQQWRVFRPQIPDNCGCKNNGKTTTGNE